MVFNTLHCIEKHCKFPADRGLVFDFRDDGVVLLISNIGVEGFLRSSLLLTVAGVLSPTNFLKSMNSYSLPMCVFTFPKNKARFLIFFIMYGVEGSLASTLLLAVAGVVIRECHDKKIIINR